MFQNWRLKIREAEAAYRGGQLAEAARLLERENLREFLPGRQLAAKVAEGVAQRAGRLAACGQSAAGWRELEEAAARLGESDPLAQARGHLLAQGMAEVEGYLAAGETVQAKARLTRLAQRHGLGSPLRTLWRVARRIEQAQAAERRGELAEAESHLAAAESLRPEWTWFSRRRKECRLKMVQWRKLNDALHRAMAKSDFGAVLTTAEAMLEIAPESPQARSARRKAWDAVGIRATCAFGAGRVGLASAEADGLRHKGLKHFGRRWGRAAWEAKRLAARQRSERFVLWIDAVGGFLVCLGSDIVLGLPGDKEVDVPILADISRRHARIVRDGEGYVVDPLRGVKLDGRPIRTAAALVDGNVLELGEGVELLFRRPHPLSASARIDFVSRHKTQPSCDGVLLMAENCVLGPSWQSHVVCRHWQQDVVLFREGDALMCRGSGCFQVNGEAATDAVRLEPGARVEGEDFSFSLEGV